MFRLLAQPTTIKVVNTNAISDVLHNVSIFYRLTSKKLCNHRYFPPVLHNFLFVFHDKYRSVCWKLCRIVFRKLFCTTDTAKSCANQYYKTFPCTTF